MDWDDELDELEFHVELQTRNPEDVNSFIHSIIANDAT